MIVLVLNQAVNLYMTGIKVERERKRLMKYIDKYGMSSIKTCKQSHKLQKLTSKFLKLEAKHIAQTEDYIERAAARI